MKKMLSLALSLVMLMGVLVPAYATDGNIDAVEPQQEVVEPMGAEEDDNETEIIGLTDSYEAMIQGISASTSGTLALNIYFTVNEALRDAEGAYAMADGVKYPLSSLTIDESTGAYKITISKVAKAFGDSVDFCVCLADGTVVKLYNSDRNEFEGDVAALSVRTYVERAVKSSDTRLVELVKAMSDYCNYAQLFFGYKTDEVSEIYNDVDALVSASDFDQYTPSKTVASEENAALSYYGSSLLLKDGTLIRHYFKLKSGSIKDWTATIDGVQYPLVRKGGYYYVQTSVAAKDLGIARHVELSNADGVQITIDYSALSYGKTVFEKSEDANLLILVKALYLYNQAAVAYFNR